MEQPLLDQSPGGESVHGIIASMLFELKQELARHTAVIEQVLTRLDKIEAHESSSGANQTKKYAGCSKLASRNHPALKVGQENHYL